MSERDPVLRYMTHCADDDVECHVDDTRKRAITRRRPVLSDTKREAAE